MLEMSYANLTLDEIELITKFFKSADADGNGTITVREIQEASDVDLDGDGQVSPDEAEACSRVWLTVFLALQGEDPERAVTLEEVLAINDEYK